MAVRFPCPCNKAPGSSGSFECRYRKHISYNLIFPFNMVHPPPQTHFHKLVLLIKTKMSFQTSCSHGLGPDSCARGLQSRSHLILLSAFPDGSGGSGVLLGWGQLSPTDGCFH